MESFFKDRQVIRKAGKKDTSPENLPAIHFFKGRVGPKKVEDEEPEETQEEIHACDDGMKVEAVTVDGRIERIIVKCGCGKETVLRCKYKED